MAMSQFPTDPGRPPVERVAPDAGLPAADRFHDSDVRMLAATVPGAAAGLLELTMKLAGPADPQWASPTDDGDRHRLADPAVPLRDLGECDSIRQ
ncbi:MAG: hypothetical protein M3Y48_19550 [Actinomycetota bacterium]|nr:hypothetical protein [Actinomycetota bacterium]